MSRIELSGVGRVVGRAYQPFGVEGVAVIDGVEN